MKRLLIISAVGSALLAMALTPAASFANKGICRYSSAADKGGYICQMLADTSGLMTLCTGVQKCPIDCPDKAKNMVTALNGAAACVPLKRINFAFAAPCDVVGTSYAGWTITRVKVNTSCPESLDCAILKKPPDTPKKRKGEFEFNGTSTDPYGFAGITLPDLGADVEVSAYGKTGSEIVTELAFQLSAQGVSVTVNGNKATISAEHDIEQICVKKKDTSALEGTVAIELVQIGPSMTQWGLIILLIVLAGIATWVVLKRRSVVTA